LKKRRHRPDRDGGEEGGVSFGKVSRSIHPARLQNERFAVSSLALQTIKASDTRF
jgi:hypothetical protein